jgi:hypothetical protein
MRVILKEGNYDYCPSIVALQYLKNKSTLAEQPHNEVKGRGLINLFVNLFKGPGNRFLCSINVYKYGLCYITITNISTDKVW